MVAGNLTTCDVDLVINSDDVVFDGAPFTDFILNLIKVGVQCGCGVARMPDSPFILRMDSTSHPFDTKSFKKKNIKHSSKFWHEKLISPKKYKDQNDRNAKIYRFKTSPDHFLLGNQ